LVAADVQPGIVGELFVQRATPPKQAHAGGSLRSVSMCP
jgi:hypothetical protein